MINLPCQAFRKEFVVCLYEQFPHTSNGNFLANFSLGGPTWTNCRLWHSDRCLFAVVPNRGHASPGGVNKFPGIASLYALYNMESLIHKFTNKYICFYNLFNVRGASNKGQLQGDAKKKRSSPITSKFLFRLTQNFSYIRSSLCSRHLQSFKSVLKKFFVPLALKKYAPNELPGPAGTFGSGGQSSRWPSRIPPLGSLLLLLWLLPSGQG